MDPFELTKDPDGGGITVRVKHGFVVLTREEERRVTERITEILAENAKLREFIDLKETCWKYVGWCDECPYNGIDDEHDNCICTVQENIDSLARELGIEVPE